MSRCAPITTCSAPPVEAGRLGDHVHRGATAHRYAPGVPGRHAHRGPAHPVAQILQPALHPVRGLCVVPRGGFPRADVAGQVPDVSLNPAGVEADRSRGRRRSRRRRRGGDLRRRGWACRSRRRRGSRRSRQRRGRRRGRLRRIRASGRRSAPARMLTRSPNDTVG